MSGFHKATRTRAKLRMALIGPPGSGKTFSALKVATYLGGRIALIDTEHGAASKYSVATEPSIERGEFDFDTLELDTFAPQKYIDAIHDAEKSGFDILIIDSLSHAWTGKGGVLELHDNAVARQTGAKNSFTAWKDVTPQHYALVEAILQSSLHVIATVRSKTEYVLEEGANGKKVPRKVGMAPVQRDGLEYEFDLVGDMDLDNRLVISKSRCHELSAAVIQKPGKELADALKAWLQQGREPVKPRVINAGEIKALNDALKEAGGSWEKTRDWLRKDAPDLPADAMMGALTVPLFERAMNALRNTIAKKKATNAVIEPLREAGDPDPSEIIDEPTKKHLEKLFTAQNAMRWSELRAKVGAPEGAKSGDLTHGQYEAAVTILTQQKAG